MKKTSILFSSAIKNSIAQFFEEDDLSRNLFYTSNLPDEKVLCELKIKESMVLSGVSFLIESFKYLDDSCELDHLLKYEGEFFEKPTSIEFELPFSVAITGERIALNLVQRSSSISTFTKKFVDKASKYNIKILDTRKTTPGLRMLEKYAVRLGGGTNHRMGQTDSWMVKDNHKKFFGGVEEAISFFNSLDSFYNNMIVEIHSLDELLNCSNAKSFMLDNFSPVDIKKAISMKRENVTYEVSGGINLSNIDEYLISGVDAISVGSLTHNVPSVDLSMKIKERLS